MKTETRHTSELQISEADKAWIAASWERFKAIPPWRHFVEDAHALCVEIEKLPASELQTSISLKAAALHKMLESWCPKLPDAKATEDAP